MKKLLHTSQIAIGKDLINMAPCCNLMILVQISDWDNSRGPLKMKGVMPLKQMLPYVGLLASYILAIILGVLIGKGWHRGKVK